MTGPTTTSAGAARDDRIASTRALYGGVLLLSLAVLLLQIALTRIFSFTLWYHFAYVTISVALLGYGASGSFLAVAPGLTGARPTARLAGLALAAAFAVVGGLAIFATMPFHPFKMVDWLISKRPWDADMAAQFVYLPLFYLTVTAPFFLVGLCITTALRACAADVGRLYFYDLAGAALGCLVVVGVINAVGTPAAVVVAAVVFALAATSFAVADGRGLGTALAGVAVVGALGVGVVATVEFEPSPEKFAAAFLDKPITKVFSHRWSAIFRTDSFGLVDEETSRTGSYASWGISPHWRAKAATQGPKIRLITHDGDAGAVVYNFDGDLGKLEMFEHLILKAPYVLLDQPNVLVIGVGGGTDILNAVKNHARHVTGVELDPATVDLVRHEQAEFAGHLYDRSDVTMIAGEGRSTLRHSAERYDLIQMTGVDTLAALSTGAYVLAESYLYTTEAVHEFLDHLTPNGLLSYTIADFNGRQGYSRHTMRLLSLLIHTLEERGLPNAAEHIAVIASTEPVPQISVLTKRSPFTAEERDRLASFADRLGFDPWVLPGRELGTPHERYVKLSPSERDAFRRSQPVVITPTTDDNPFFFNFYAWSRLRHHAHEVDVGHTLATGQLVLAALLVIALVLSAIFILGPLAVFSRRGVRTPGRVGFLLFFVAIGLGFILIEISFIQKFVLFLGYPTYSLTVVLCALLASSGVGSFLTGRLRTPPAERFLPLLLALAAVSLAYLAGLPPLFASFLGAAFAVRVLIASLVLVPLGLVMGMFFPSGIELVRRANDRFVPWAWAANGCASVVGTVLAVMLAMSFGFRVVTLIALAIYTVGVVGIRASARHLVH